MIKTDLAAPNNQNLLVLHLPGEDERASTLDLRELVMRHDIVLLLLLWCCRVLAAQRISEPWLLKV